MSSTTSTPNYGLLKPNVGADNDLWGDHWNQNADVIDTQLKQVSNKAGVTTFNTRAGAVTLSNADVVTVLPAATTVPLMDGTASIGLGTKWAKDDHVHPTDTTRAAASSVPSPSATAPTMNSVADAGVAVAYSRGDHTHPSDTSRYAASNPSGYQTAAQVTTALVPYAPLASPALTGSPTAPTVTPSTDSSTKIASTAFVQSALGAVPGGAVIAATAPAGLNPGALWWDSTGGQLYVRYDDGNTQQFVVATNVSGGASAGDVAMAQNNVGRNKLHNGLFTVAQRGRTAINVTPVSTIVHTADRWAAIILAAGDALSIAVLAHNDTNRAAIGDDAAQWLLSCGFTGGAAAGNGIELFQRIEDVSRISGKTVIVSFWANAGTSLQLGVNLSQAFGTGGSPSAGVLVGAKSVALTSTWTRYSLTFVMPGIAGKTLGTNSNDNTQLEFWFSAGSSNTARAGIGVQSGTINLWGVQLEIAAPGQTQPSPLEKLDPRMELSNCQRFYQQIFGVMSGSVMGGAGAFYFSVTLPTPMRAQPTVVVGSPTYGNAGAAAAAGATQTVIAFSATASGAGVAWAQLNFSASADL